MLPMTFEELAESGFRLAPFRHPRKALVCTADRPQQGERLVERLAASRRPVQSQRGEQLDQLPDGQARHCLSHLEAETAQQVSDGRRPAAEVGGGKRFPAGKEAVCRAHDCLRIVGLAVNHQLIRASLTEPVLFEESVLAEPVILRHGLKNLAAGQLPQCHTAMVSTCVWQSCQTQPVADHRQAGGRELTMLRAVGPQMRYSLRSYASTHASPGHRQFIPPAGNQISPRRGGTEKSGSSRTWASLLANAAQLRDISYGQPSPSS